MHRNEWKWKHNNQVLLKIISLEHSSWKICFPYLSYNFLYLFLLIIILLLMSKWAFLVAQTVKNLPAGRETWVQFLGQEDPLEKVMATHSSILVWRIPWTEDPSGLQSMGLHVSKSWTQLFTFTYNIWNKQGLKKSPFR